MHRTVSRELDLGSVLELVAAHARTRAGRLLVSAVGPLPSPAAAVAACALTRELEELVAVNGPLPLSGVDDALPYLEPGAPITVEPAALLVLAGFARRVEAVRRATAGLPEAAERLRELAAGLPDLADLVAWVGPRLGRDGVVPDSASPELGRLRRQVTRLRQQVMAELEVIRRGHPEVATDAPPTVRRDRYCLPVRSAARGQLPGLLLDSSGSGATSYLEPLAVVELNNDLVDAVARAEEEERRILAEIAAAFGGRRTELVRAAGILVELDAAQARVLFGRAVGGRVVAPDGERLVLRGARHPLLDERLRGLRAELFGEHRDEAHRAVPLDLELPPAIRTLVVSGPNAGGKTVVLKTVGVMVLLAFHGVPLPVDEGSAVPAYDHVWCHIGDEQDVAADLSTFSGAMAATAELLQRSGARSLVLYDELGAGTDPLEGAALGCAVLEELTRRGCLTIATTHLAAIAMSATSGDGMDNGAMEFDEAAGRPTYRLRIGRPGRSRGLEIAHRMGLPAAVLARSRQLLGDDHLVLDRWLERLEALEAELLAERGELVAGQRELAARRAALDDERRRREAEHEQALARVSHERDRLRARAKSQLDSALAELERATHDVRPLGRRARQKLRDQALDLGTGTSVEAPATEREPAPGSRVRLATLGAEGVLEEVRGERGRVAVGDTRIWVELGEVVVVGGAPAPARPRLEVAVEESVPSELKLLGLDAEEARARLEHHLDRADAAGLTLVRIVHGHGTGTLRRMVREVCAGHPAVRSFRHPPQGRGGTGVTEAELGA